ncbi:MAG: hypothetical protein ACTSRP_12460 [Candidatus Helarchaeota archaeon]
MLTPLHIFKSLKRRGKSFKAVHEWLDNCNVQPYVDFNKYFMQHRIERHNPYGLDYVYKIWGKEALIEAIIHLRDDGYKLIYKKRKNKIDILWL